MIRAFIFDLGGVILSRGLWFFRDYLIRTYGVTDEQTRDVFIKKYYKAYFTGKMSEESFWVGVLRDLNIKTDWRDLKIKLLEFYTPNDGMFNLVDSLRAKGYKTYLLSDQTNDWWPILDRNYSISAHFDKTFISSEIGFHKPEKEFYEFVLVDIGFLPEETLFVDDLEENLVPARELGIKTFLYADTEKLKAGLKDIF